MSLRFWSGITWIGIAVWCIAFQPWGAFIDPDGFYHATMGALLWKQGILRDFPWLDLTSFAHPFVNQHFGYHVILAPFTALFGTLYGTQLASVVLMMSFVLVLYLCLKKQQVNHPLFWTTIAITLSPFAARLSYQKASSLAISLFFIGTTAFTLRKPWLAFVILIPYVLSHAGWPLLLLTMGAMLIGSLLYEWVIEGQNVLSVLKSKRHLESWMVFASACFGAIVGFLLHPYRAELLGFLRVQIVSIGVATPTDKVIMGSEWYGIALSTMLIWISVFIFFGIITLYAKKSHISERLTTTAMRRALEYALPTCFLFALTIKSTRFIEYLIPLLIGVFAHVYTLFDLRETLHSWWQSPKRWYGLALVSISMVFFLVQRAYFYIEMMTLAKPFTRYVAADKALRSITVDGDRIFTSDWAVMPELFALNQDARYVFGLDPTFLLVQAPELSDHVTDLTLGKATSTAYQVIANETSSTAVFVQRPRGRFFEQALQQDTRFEFIYGDTGSAVYRVHR